MTRRRCDQRGSATVLVVAFAGVLMLLGAAFGVVAAMVHAHRVAQSGADLSALAAARSLALGRDGCAEAAAIARANGVRLTTCRATGPVVTVSVVAPGPHWLGQTSDLSAEARAGPG
jgi:secretion/DNA translocation related TadE-like protein